MSTPDGGDPEDPFAPQYTPEMLDAFRRDVRMWIEMDNTLRILQESIRERRKEKRLLTARILRFMQEHKIDDLNTPVGRLRFQVRRVKAPLSQQEILDRISDYYKNDVLACQQLRAAVFGNRSTADKASIRRIPWRQSAASEAEAARR